MDSKDWKIFNILRNNGRAFIKEIAKELDMPHSTVYERIKRMKSEGIIKKFTIQPDYKKLGYRICAYLLISFDPRCKKSQSAVAGKIAKIKNVHEVHIITGDWDILVKMRAEDIDSLREMIVEKIRNMEGVEKTHTIIVLDTLKEIC